MLSRRNFFTLSFTKRQTNTPFSDSDLHFLNRITWGVRPEELTRLKQIGKAAYLEEQLNPEALDDGLLEAKLAHLPMLKIDRQTLMQFVESGEERLYRTLIESMVLRAVYSRAQLLERMVDFWSDHFNVPLGEEIHDLILYQREAIRKNALGNFHDLLMATAKQPAMLIYLDNFCQCGRPSERELCTRIARAAYVGRGWRLQ